MLSTSAQHSHVCFMSMHSRISVCTINACCLHLIRCCMHDSLDCITVHLETLTSLHSINASLFEAPAPLLACLAHRTRASICSAHCQFLTTRAFLRAWTVVVSNQLPTMQHLRLVITLPPGGSRCHPLTFSCRFMTPLLGPRHTPHSLPCGHDTPIWS